MKNFDKKTFNPFIIAFGAIMLTVFDAIIYDMGKIDAPRSLGDLGIDGIIFAAFFLIYPFINKKIKEYLWSKKGIIVLSSAIIVSLPITIICIHNRLIDLGWI